MRVANAWGLGREVIFKGSALAMDGPQSTNLSPFFRQLDPGGSRGLQV